MMRANLAFLGDTVDLLWALGGAYWQEGRFFLILHLLVAILVAEALWQIISETRALTEWATNGQRRPEGAPQLASLYHKFAEDTRELGGNSIVVPITDYSERAEQAAEEIETRLNDRVHWFLFIGIAGTLVGLFQFAVAYTPDPSSKLTPPAVMEQVTDPTATPAPGQRSASERKLDDFEAALIRVQETPDILAAAMRTAFPIGVMGLVLTVFGQFLAGAFERRLHVALSAANRRALQLRVETMIPAVNLAERITTALAAAVQPLTAMGEVFSEQLREAIKSQFRDLQSSTAVQLAEVQEALANRLLEIERSTGSIEEASRTFYAHIDALARAVGELPTILAAAPDVLAQTRELQEYQRVKLEELGKALYADLEAAAGLLDKVDEAIDAFGRVPDVLAARSEEALRGTLEGLGTRVGDEWLQTVQTGRETIEKELRAAQKTVENELFARQTVLETVLNKQTEGLRTRVTELMDEIARLNIGLRDTGTRMLDVAEDMKAPVTEAIGAATTAIETTIRPLTPMLQQFRDATISATGELKTLATETETALVKPIRDISAEASATLTPLIESHRATLVNSSSLFERLTTTLTVVESSLSAMQSAIAAFERSAELHASVPRELQALIQDIRSERAALNERGTNDAGRLAHAIDELKKSVDLMPKNIEKLAGAASHQSQTRSSAPPPPPARGNLDKQLNFEEKYRGYRKRVWWNPLTWGR